MTFKRYSMKVLALIAKKIGGQLKNRPTLRELKKDYNQKIYPVVSADCFVDDRIREELARVRGYREC